jgi:hypothetical protein
VERAHTGVIDSEGNRFVGLSLGLEVHAAHATGEARTRQPPRVRAPVRFAA